LGMPFGPADIFESNPFTWDCMSIAHRMWRGCLSLFDIH
jgi:hypothetical protein